MEQGSATPEELGLETDWHHFSQVLEASTNEVPPPVKVDKNDPAVIQFTGGTTGTPKGAILTHHNLVVGAHCVFVCGNPVFSQYAMNRKYVLSVLPFFHVYGEIVALCFSILTTCTQVILPRFNIDEVMSTMALFKDIMFWPAVPTMISAAINHPRAAELSTWG